MTTGKRRRLMATRDRIKRIHVDQRAIRHNIDCDPEDRLPPITVQTSAGSVKASAITIQGPSRVVYRPHDPLSCGARLWVETTAAVSVDA